MASEEGESTFLRYGPLWVKHAWEDGPHPFVYEQYKLESVEFFFKSTKLEASAKGVG